MRLIDADALIGSLHCYGFCDGIDRTMVYRIIQLQPTIEPELHGVCNNCLFGNICRFKAGLGEYGFCSQWKPQEEGDE